MRKLLLFAIILFIIVSCKKESKDNSNDETCNTCTITQKWYINGIYNHTTTVSNTFLSIIVQKNTPNFCFVIGEY